MKMVSVVPEETDLLSLFDAIPEIRYNSAMEELL
jgi:hypothetical protein